MAKIIVGMLAAIVGAYFYFGTSASSTLCSSALISAINPTQCDEVNAMHTIGGFAMLIGIAIIAWGIVVKVRA